MTYKVQEAKYFSAAVGLTTLMIISTMIYSKSPENPNFPLASSAHYAKIEYSQLCPLPLDCTKLQGEYAWRVDQDQLEWRLVTK